MDDHRRQQLIFYVALPAVIGFLLGANQTGIGQFLPWGLSVFFWVTCTLASWAVFHVGTLVAAALLRPWEPALIIKLAVGLLLASLPARLMINQYLGLFDPFLAEGRTVRSLPEATLTLGFIQQYLKVWSGPYVVWIAANVFFDRVVGFSRYRAPIGAAAEAPPSPPVSAVTQREPVAPATTRAQDVTPDAATISALLSSLPRALGLNIVAIKSEDHYLRVYTDRGETLVLYKLSVAIEELERLGYDGLQVHRSYWVRRAAVTGVEQSGRMLRIRLNTGLEAPVSQTYREIVRKAGFLPDAPPQQTSD